jgi:flagellar hook-associated protein 1 FlgK
VSINNISIINNAYSALEIAQAGMTITSQNVNGANVEGFSRRRSNNVIGLMAPNSRDFGSTAFAVEGFTRFVDNLLTKQMLDQRSKSSYTSTLLQSVSGLDSLLMDPSSSIQDAVSKFMNAAGTLANDAGSLTNIQNFAGAATQLANRISSFNEYLNEIKKSTQVNMTGILNEANTLAPALQRINQQILASSAPGNTTPSADILDERDRITMRLQDLLGGSTIINEDGTATFQIAGVSLVDRSSASQFINTDVGVSDGALFNVFVKESQTGHLIGPLSTKVEVNPNSGASGQQYIKSKTIFQSGQVGATFSMLSDFLPKVQQQLSSLTLGIFRDVNSIKTKGDATTISPVFGYKASGGGFTTAIPSVLTTKYAQDTNGNLLTNSGQWYPANPEANGRVLKIEEIMLASDPTSSSYNATIAAAVNNQIPNSSYGASSFVSMISYGPEAAVNFSIDAVAANRIEQLRSKFSNPLSLITSNIASTVSSWKNLDQVNQVVGKQLADRRESISGINLDEEAANLVKFQQMYGAASKVMQTANEMFNMLLNMLSR